MLDSIPDAWASGDYLQLAMIFGIALFLFIVGLSQKIGAVYLKEWIDSWRARRSEKARKDQEAAEKQRDHFHKKLKESDHIRQLTATASVERGLMAIYRLLIAFAFISFILAVEIDGLADKILVGFLVIGAVSNARRAASHYSKWLDLSRAVSIAVKYAMPDLEVADEDVGA